MTLVSNRATYFAVHNVLQYNLLPHNLIFIATFFTLSKREPTTLAFLANDDVESVCNIIYGNVCTCNTVFVHLYY